MSEYIDRDALLAEAKRISGPMTGRFILMSVDNPNAPYYENIIADKETGVMYLVMYKLHQFGITPLLNADGSPMTLDEINQTEEGA